MSELDKLLDAVMKQKEELISEQVTDADKNEMIIALREKKKTEIVNEIKQEYKQQLKEEVDIEAEQKLHQQKIDDLKSLMWSGFFLAFLVGMAVNQVTEFIGFYKGTVQMNSVRSTVVLSLIFIAICIVAYLLSFLNNALSIIKKWKERNI